MKIITLAVVALALMAVGSVRAQYEQRDSMGEGYTSTGTATSRTDRNIKREVDRLTRDLSLTPQQQGAVRAALEKRREKRNEPLAEATRQDILAVLTPEQRVKFDQLKGDRYHPKAGNTGAGTQGGYDPGTGTQGNGYDQGTYGTDNTMPSQSTGTQGTRRGVSPSTTTTPPQPMSTEPNEDMPPAGR